MKLGKMKEINIRKVWEHEQYDFSKWLATDENIAELGNTLNLSLTDVETEKFVGNYRCDILCKDELTGKTVLIENQLESTNHDHLGKIITYASGLEASVIVWIVGTARQEHASAIEWLNKHTDNEVAFFLIEVHAYTIGNSEPAPMFKMIEQPNDFSKNAKQYSKGELNKSESCRLEFWTMFNEVVTERGKPFKIHKASTDHWYFIAMGSSQCHLSIDLVNKEHKIRTGFWIYDNKEMYDDLLSHKTEIERIAETKLTWKRLDDKKASLICMYISGLDFDHQENYSELMNKAIDNILILTKAFKNFI